MRTRSFFFSLPVILGVIALYTSGCVTINLGSEATVEPPAAPTPMPPAIPTDAPEPLQPILMQETLLNMQYLSPMVQQVVQLENGEFSGVVDGVELNVKQRPGFAFGDLNYDGIEDAALLISENTGGSGIFVSLIVVYSQGSVFRQAPAVLIDDRPILDDLSIQEDRVRLSGLVHGPNDPMVNPTTSFSAEYRLFGDRLVTAQFSSAYQGGAEHSISIDSPLDGEEVSGSVVLSGRMPIGPFENNLVLTIQDQAGNELMQTGFMVQTEDMGAPATFSNAVALPAAAVGTELLVTLSELSMADGTPMAIDSVLVKVK